MVRALNRTDPFEMAVARQLGDALGRDDGLCRELWSALANVRWECEDGNIAAYSFRSAGDLIAAVRGGGDYLDWYCCGPDGVVSDRIAAALGQEGWWPQRRGRDARA